MSDLSTRRLTPEILDALPADDPRAQASRRDLVRINALMGNAGILATLLRAGAETPPRTLVEIGAGDGALTLRLARRLAPVWQGVDITLLDINPSVPDGVLARIEALGWRPTVLRADVFDWGAETGPTFDAGYANLILHHFEDDALIRLMNGLARRTRLFAACETQRTAPAHLASRLVGFIGANDVSRHDARVSVEAGFRDGELTARWPGETRVDARRGPFSQGFLGLGVRDVAAGTEMGTGVGYAPLASGE